MDKDKLIGGCGKESAGSVDPVIASSDAGSSRSRMHGAGLYLRAIALVMAFLIVDMPLSSIGVLAFSDITVTKATGADGFSTIKDAEYVGFRQQDDSLAIDAHVELDTGAGSNASNASASSNSSDIDISQVTFSVGSGFYKADSCSGSGAADCSKFWEHPVIFQHDQRGTVRLYDSSGSLKKSRTFRIITDTEKPKIKMSLSPDDVSNGKVTVSYEVTDSYSSSCSQNREGTSCLCVGLDSVLITEAGDENGTEILSEAPSEQPGCSLAGSVEHISEINGLARYCVTAADRFGNAASKCMTVFIDNQPPKATGLMLNYTFGSHEEVAFLPNRSSGGIEILMTVPFDYPDIDPSSVRASLKQISGKRSAVGPDSCRIRKGHQRCEWRFKAYADESLTPSIDINYSDFAGNRVEDTLNAGAIKADSEGPVITSLEVETKGWQGTLSDGSWLVASRSNFTARITENLFENNMISLDLSEAGGEAGLRPTECVKSGSSYVCRWVEPAMSCNECKASVRTAGTVDDLGNPAKKEAEINITADTTGPLLKTITLRPIHALEDSYGNRTVKGDTIYVEAILEDPGDPVTAVSNFSEVAETSGDDFASRLGGCVDLGGGEWNCTMVSHEISTDEFGVKEVSFTFRDEIGNPTYAKAYLYLYGIENESESMYWDISIHCSPKNIMRQMAEMANVRSYCQLQLIPKSDDTLTPLDIVLGKCSESDGYDRTDYISSTRLYDTHNSFFPYLRAEFKAKTIDTDYLKLVCPVSLLTEVRGSGKIISGLEKPDLFYYTYSSGSAYPSNVKIVTDSEGLRYVTSTNNYETVNVSFEFGFYNNSLEDVARQSKQKIRGILDDTAVKQEWIGKLQKFANMAENLCNIVYLMNSVANIINIGKWAWEVVSDTGVGEGAAQAYMQVADGFEVSEKTWFNYALQFCAYVSCDSSWHKASGKGARFGAGWYEKLRKALELKLGTCESSSAGSEGSSVAADEEDVSAEDYRINEGSGSKASGSGRSGSSKKSPASSPVRLYEVSGSLPVIGLVPAQASSAGSSGGSSAGAAEGSSSIPGVSGGGGGICVAAWPEDVKDSCVLSIATLCLPGVISCAQRYRNVECIYGFCLLETVDARLNPSICEDQHAYLECKFKLDEIFSVIPFVSTVKKLSSSFIEALKNPIGIITGLADYFICRLIRQPVPNAVCEATKYLVHTTTAIVAQIVATVENKRGGLWGDDYQLVDACDEYFLPKAEEMGITEGDG